MMRALCLLALLAQVPSPVPQQVEPALRSAIEQFFATQEAEDVDAYLALWSSTAAKPAADQLRTIFNSGDDKFIDLQIERAEVSDVLARVRVSITRARTTAGSTNPDGTLRIASTSLQTELTFVREGDAWKLTMEGSPVDSFAAALINEADAGKRAAMLDGDPGLVNARLLEALTRRADQQAQTSRNKAAQEIFVRALEVARGMHDRRAEGRMLQNIATSLYFQRDYPGALAVYEQRLSIERETGNQDGIASALVGIATIRYSTQEYSAALKVYREALAIQENLHELLVATTLLSTGNVLYLQGDYDGAIADYKRSESLKRKYADLLGAASALEGLGRTYLAQGDLASALLAFSAVLSEGQARNDRRRQGTALQSIGETHFRLGNLDAARSAFDEARRQFEAMNDLANAGRTAQGTGVTELVAARFPQAENAYTKSNSLCLAASDNECMAGALVGLAFAQASQQHFDEAIASYRRSIAAFRGLGNAEATARAQVGLAEALSGKKDYVAALIEAGNARSASIGLGNDDVLWRALVSQARAQRSLKRAADAAAAAAAAVSAVQRIAAQSLVRPGDPVSRDTSAAYVTHAILQAEAGDVGAALQTVEQMRVHALRVALAINERDIAGGLTDVERNDERTAAGDVRALVAQIARAKSLPKPDAPRIARLELDLAAAADKRKVIEDRIFARVPDLRVWRGLAPPATLDEIGTLIEDDGALLVQFVVDDHDLLILTAGRSEGRFVPAAHIVKVERQALAEDVARAVGSAALADVTEWRTASAGLFKLLPAAVVSQLLSARRVTIVPDDMLWRVPFEAMPVGTGYLADATSVSYAASATALVRAPALQGIDRFRVFASFAPDLSAEIVETVKSTAPSWALRPPATAEVEADRLEAAIGQDDMTSVRGAAATERALREGGATSSVLHLAVPFRINSAAPLFSPALLARTGKEQTSDNGTLEMREVPTAGIRARVVVFSDPSTMAMRESAASAPVLHWIWRSGGADTLILRRWGVDDAATNELLVSFYRLMQDGVPARVAMAQASAALRKPGAMQPPAVWAGWLVLDGRAGLSGR
jgi:tetratricopeptide (TPR) repeat protein